MNFPIIGYEWYIKDSLGWYRPHEKTFLTYNEALQDGLKYYDIIYIGINKIENDDGLITVLEECKSCIDYQYDDETLDDMIDYFGF